MVEFLVLEKKNDDASSGLPFQVFETVGGMEVTCLHCD